MHYQIKHKTEISERRYTLSYAKDHPYSISSIDDCRKLIADPDYTSILPIVILPELIVQEQLSTGNELRTNFSAIIFEYILSNDETKPNAEKIFIICNRKDYTDVVGYVHLQKDQYDFWIIKDYFIYSPFENKGFMIDLIINVIRFDNKIKNVGTLMNDVSNTLLTFDEFIESFYTPQVLRAKILNSKEMSRVFRSGAISPEAVSIINTQEFSRWLLGRDDEWDSNYATNLVKDIIEKSLTPINGTDARTLEDGLHINIPSLMSGQHFHKLIFDTTEIINQINTLLSNRNSKKWLQGDELDWTNQLYWNFTQLFSVRYGQVGQL